MVYQVLEVAQGLVQELMLELKPRKLQNQVAKVVMYHHIRLVELRYLHLQQMQK